MTREPGPNVTPWLGIVKLDAGMESLSIEMIVPFPRYLTLLEVMREMVVLGS